MQTYLLSKAPALHDRLAPAFLSAHNREINLLKYFKPPECKSLDSLRSSCTSPLNHFSKHLPPRHFFTLTLPQFNLSSRADLEGSKKQNPF